MPVAGNERPIDASAVAAIAGLSTLQRLSLFAGRIGDKGAARIVRHAKEDCWPELQHLDVGACDLSLVGVQRLVEALLVGALPALQVCSAACLLPCDLSVVSNCAPSALPCCAGAVRRGEPSDAGSGRIGGGSLSAS